ncbi:hypothetical protein AK830_g11905 [Neonectria ditissima]|uniref:Uncharacterized protein n=1 Tax=Neonectria ditissima TaxID=78410 RepID=A0A0P7AQF7_9HYPO|nr:hypothetical protein AK830_g11905 [Neonectria ditissima]
MAFFPMGLYAYDNLGDPSIWDNFNPPTITTTTTTITTTTTLPLPSPPPPPPPLKRGRPDDDEKEEEKKKKKKTEAVALLGDELTRKNPIFREYSPYAVVTTAATGKSHIEKRGRDESREDDKEEKKENLAAGERRPIVTVAE